MDQYFDRHFYGPAPELFPNVAALIRANLGCEIDRDPWNCTSYEMALRHHDDELVKTFLVGVRDFLLLLARRNRHACIRIDGHTFSEIVNRILEDEGSPVRLHPDGWMPLVTTQAELLRRVLLQGRDDVAPCRQGDIQVETVASTLQAKLSTPGATLLDYGAGLGRVLKGLSSAPLLGAARYIAVDEPISPSLKHLCEEVGVAELVSRTDFLTGTMRNAFDAAFALNVLHHIPFSDLPRQIATLLAALKRDGILLLHEMGELREPEQRNVPWAESDIVSLFEMDGITVNPRSTVTSGKKVPLTNCIVTVQRLPTTAEIGRRASAVWRTMKERTLGSIDDLYKAKDETRHLELQQALIINANLDLNRPADP